MRCPACVAGLKAMWLVLLTARGVLADRLEISVQIVPSQPTILPVEASVTSIPFSDAVSELARAVNWAGDRRGGNTPLVVELISSIALSAGEEVPMLTWLKAGPAKKKNANTSAPFLNMELLHTNFHVLIKTNTISPIPHLST